MPRISPHVVHLTEAEREELTARARRYTSPYREVIRAKVVLLAAQGLSNDVIAARLDPHARSSASGASASVPSDYPA